MGAERQIGLGMRRSADESWREAVKRVSSKFGLDLECLEWFDAEIVSGSPEEAAAWAALYEWDVLDLYVDGEPKESTGVR